MTPRGGDYGIVRSKDACDRGRDHEGCNPWRAADFRASAPSSVAAWRRYTESVRAHEWIDRRSLALHDAVAAKLEAQPELLELARANLQRWLRLNPAPALHEWAHLLDSLSGPALVGLLRSADERATRLRQSSPFAGLLTDQERQAILNDYESRRP